jgi:hypothetical protein
MRMPGYMGSAWRGGFGRALRRAVCVTGSRPARVAASRQAASTLICSRPRRAVRTGFLAGYDRVPNPFVLAPPWNEGRLVPERGETGLCLVLIGRAIEHTGFARQAVVEAGLRGLSPDRGALDLVAVEPIALPPTPPCSNSREFYALQPREGLCFSSYRRRPEYMSAIGTGLRRCDKKVGCLHSQSVR